MEKILSLQEIIEVISLNRIKQKVTFCSGAFDLFHYGHFKMLKKSSTPGNTLIVQVDGNRLVRKRKGNNRPYLDQSYRALMISSLEFVDFVFISDIPSEDKKTLSAINPDIFVRAILPDESEKDRIRREQTLLTKIPKAKIVWLEQSQEISTTQILTVIKPNNHNNSHKKFYV